jgi:DNA mismatch repair protein MutS
MNTAADEAIAVENEIFEELRKMVCAEGASIGEAALALAGIDVASSLAILAHERNYTRPVITTG